MHSFLPRLYSSVSNLHFSLVWSLVYILCSHQLFAHSLGSDQQRTEHFLYKNYRYSSHPLCFAATLLLLLLTTIFYSLDKITQKVPVLLKLKRYYCRTVLHKLSKLWIFEFLKMLSVLMNFCFQQSHFWIGKYITTFKQKNITRLYFQY